MKLYDQNGDECQMTGLPHMFYDKVAVEDLVRVKDARIAELERENEKYEEALQRIAKWSDAYPLDVFPEPDLKKAREVLSAAGLSLDQISASNMRHVITRVAEIARTAL